MNKYIKFFYSAFIIVLLLISILVSLAKLTDYVYVMPFILAFLSVISIGLAIKNKNKKNNKYIIIGNIINILYMFIISILLYDTISIIVDIEIIFIWFVALAGGILSIISIIICIVKNKKLNNTSEKSKLWALLIFIFMPIIIFMLSFYRETYLMNHSKILLECHSSGNGGMLEGREFVYAINDKYCKEISIDLCMAGDWLLPEKMQKLKENKLNEFGYKAVLKDDENNVDCIYIYKNDELIHKVQINLKYRNNDIKYIYYIE